MWLLFLFVGTSWCLLEATSCPSECDCVPLAGSLHATCHPSSPSTPSWPSSLRSLTIHCSRIPLIPSSFLADLRDLQELRVFKCAIDSLRDGISGLSHLRKLSLHETRSVDDSVLGEWMDSLDRLEKLQVTDVEMTVLPDSLLCWHPLLQELNVSGNALSSMAVGCPAPNLMILDLSRNRFTHISEQLLSPFQSIRILRLDGNQVESVSSLPKTVMEVRLSDNRVSDTHFACDLPLLEILDISHNAVSSFSCPLPQSLKTLDSSWNVIHDSPILDLSNLTLLRLSHNSITRIHEHAFHGCPNLRTIELNSNALVEVGDIFGLTHLTHIDLSNNSIRAIDDAAFVELGLDHVDLSWNRLEKVPRLADVKRARTIDLSHNNISAIEDFVFSRVPQLQRLDLSHNNIEKVESNQVSDCAHLQWLSLANNGMSDLPMDSLWNSDSIRFLDVSHNRLKALRIHQSAHSIKKLLANENEISVLDWGSLPAALEVLDVSHNNLSFIQGKPREVTDLFLSHNLLRSLTAEMLPDKLENIDLSHNHINRIANETLSAKTALRFIDLSHNKLEEILHDSMHTPDSVHSVRVMLQGNPLKCTCNIDWLKAQLEHPKPRIELMSPMETKCRHQLDGRLVSLSAVKREGLLCGYSWLCERCGCCELGDCDCRSVCPVGCSCFHDASSSTNIVRCDALNITHHKLFSTSDLPMEASHVYLSRFPLHNLTRHSFFGMKKLLHLHMSAMQLRVIESMSFNALPSLQLLDLSGNELRDLASDALYMTDNITHLYLNDNRLERFDGDIVKKLRRLKLLTLHNNRLRDVPPLLSSMSSLESLNLSGNPFRCDCGRRFNSPFLLAENGDKIVDGDQMVCMENVTKAFRENDTTILSAFPPNHGDQIFIINMLDFLREVNVSICAPSPSGVFGGEPSSSFLLVVLVSAVFLVFLLLIIVALKKAHNVNSRSGVFLSSHTGSTRSPLPEHLLQYDIFVSYSKKDEKMVVEHLCTPLEAGYSLCLLHRDCGPQYDDGRHAVSDELTSQMKQSNAILIIVSRNFLLHEWKSFHINFSHKLIAKDNRIKLIAIFCDDVDKNSAVDPELGQILRKNTQIQLSDTLFWNHLNSALPPPMVPCDSSSQVYSDVYGVVVPSAIV